jgi:hypothetical protein
MDGQPVVSSGDAPSQQKSEKPGHPSSGSGSRGAQDKKLTRGEIKKLKDKGIDPEELKREVFPGGPGKTDLYKTPTGDIVVKGKGGVGPGEPTGINIRDLD